MHAISKAIRPVFFQNASEEWPYSTHGGTMFLVSYKKKCYGLTCKHVLSGFDPSQLFVARDSLPKQGTPPAPVSEFAYIDGEGEIADVAIIIFKDEINNELFDYSAYRFRYATIGSSNTAHKLHVYGFLKDKTTINYDTKAIIGGFCDLEVRDIGAVSNDYYLRYATATYVNHGFERITGVSGAAIFDETANKLCGMAVRGGLDNGIVKLWYVDISHIFRALEAVHEPRNRVSYVIAPPELR